MINGIYSAEFDLVKGIKIINQIKVVL